MSAAELKKGWNMSELTEGPIAAQCRNVLAEIEKKETAVSAYRDLAKWRAAEWLARNRTLDLKGAQETRLDRRIKIVLAASAGGQRRRAAPAAQIPADGGESDEYSTASKRRMHNLTDTTSCRRRL